MKRDARLSLATIVGGTLIVGLLVALVFAFVTRSPLAGSPDLVPIPTSEAVPPWAPCHGALLEGVLVPDEDWGLAVLAAENVEVTRVLWPHGYVGRSVAGNGVELLNSAGDVVAVTGDTISLGGGGLDEGFRVCPHAGHIDVDRAAP